MTRLLIIWFLVRIGTAPLEIIDGFDDDWLACLKARGGSADLACVDADRIEDVVVAAHLP